VRFHVAVPAWGAVDWLVCQTNLGTGKLEVQAGKQFNMNEGGEGGEQGGLP
jgi:hypothetical protein